jgi:hypothetical protein
MIGHRRIRLTAPAALAAVVLNRAPGAPLGPARP